MTRRFALAAATCAFWLAIGSGAALGEEDGIWDQARIGCGCHTHVVPLPPITQPIATGLPTILEGYVPGQSYDLTIDLLGVNVSVENPSAVGGFGFEVTAGLLEKIDDADDSLQLRVWSECDLLEFITGCERTAEKDTCGVEGDETCTTAADCYLSSCSTPGSGNCRACRAGEIIYRQGVHTLAGNDMTTWQLRWIAPDPGVGNVTFYLSGNRPDGDGSNSGIDLWGTMQPISLPQATQ